MGNHKQPPLRWPPGRGLALLGGAIIGLLSMPAGWASPRLSCEIMQAGRSQTLEFAPVVDPYGARAIDINGHFRFKAVVVAKGAQVDYVNIYAYYLADKRAVLLHQAKYLQPLSQKEAAPAHGLTGVQYLYSPPLGREMKYGCALLERSP